MAKQLTRANYDAIRDHLFDRIHRTGEAIKNDFPNVLRTAIQTEAWKHFSNAEGKPFANLVEWLTCSFPLGIGMGHGRHVITYEEALKLTEEAAKDVHRVLAENAPTRPVGRPSKHNGASTLHYVSRHGNHSKTTITLSVRLAQEKPKYYERYLRGDYTSITAAATAAGLLKDDLNLRRAKSAFRRMTAQQRAEFLKWIKSDATL